MKTIQFLTACLVRDYRTGTPNEESYTVGQIVTLSDSSAQHWLNRKKAVEVAPPEPAPEPESPPTAKSSAHKAEEQAAPAPPPVAPEQVAPKSAPTPKEAATEKQPDETHDDAPRSHARSKK